MAAGGDAIARDDDGRVVFVTGALPGERVRVELDLQRRDYAHGHVLDVLEAAPERMAPPCPHVARGCGGCQWQHVSLDGQRELKRSIVLDALRRLGHIEGIVLEPTVELPADGYRTTVRAAVVGGRAGYRRSRSHEVVAIDSCLVAHPRIEELMVDGRYGAAAEVTLRCGARTGERLAAPTPSNVDIEVPEDVRRDTFHEMVAGRRWRVSASSFFQARPDGADALADLVAGAAATAATPSRAVDLYSGVGLFAGVLADAGWSVTAVEGSDSAVADARVNLAADAVDVVGADVLQWQPHAAALVVADPSRKGLAAAGVDVVAATGADTLVLISCDAAALGRDTGLLRMAGYRPSSITPVDLFPHTVHVEVVTVFER
ncbi:MAG: hypothetical protein QOE35_3098 [Actinomycetota bacterium]|jgi:23S rRNA (uracil1939-C5)-methyltransferase